MIWQQQQAAVLLASNLPHKQEIWLLVGAPGDNPGFTRSWKVMKEFSFPVPV